MAFKHISLKSKLVFMLLGIALGCILIVGYQGLSNGKKALTDRIYNQLTSVRESKRSQVQDWFGEMQNHVRALATDHTVIRAMREFSSAYGRLEENALDDNELHSLTDYYQTTYLPALRQTVEGEPTLEQYLPSAPAARYLQYQYISGNDYKTGEKAKLDQSKDHSYYSSIHAYYHPVFHSFAENYDFYDMFLIDLESGNIVYSVAKEPDYATSLTSGPYRTSNFGQLFNEIYQTQDPGDVRMSDFAFYRPSGGQPANFMGTTIFDEDNKAIGILAIQLPVSRLNAVMTGNKGWQEQGLGETGEAFLVGNDYLMRSDARRLFAEGDCYANNLNEKMLMDKTTANRVCQLKTSILLQKVDNKAIRQALAGDSGTLVVDSYTGEKALVAYAPLLLGNLKWAITAQIDLNEANQPIFAFQKELGISTVIIASIITFLAMTLAAIFTRPITELMKAFHNLSQGNADTHLEMNRNDEYGELAKSLNSTADLIKHQQQQLQAKSDENHQLLLNTLPAKVVRHIEHGHKHYAEHISNVSILYATIGGFDEYADGLEPQEAIRQLNYIFSEFDALAKEYGVEPVKTTGDSYIAASGLNISRLDHANRCAELSLDLLEKIHQFNRQHQTSLALRVGIHTGSVTAGIIGHGRLSYDLLGEAIRIAGRIRFETSPNSVVISEQIYEKLSNPELFGISRQVTTQAMDTLKVYIHDPAKQTTNMQEKLMLATQQPRSMAG